MMKTLQNFHLPRLPLEIHDPNKRIERSVVLFLAIMIAPLEWLLFRYGNPDGRISTAVWVPIVCGGILMIWWEAIQGPDLPPLIPPFRFRRKTPKH